MVKSLGGQRESEGVLPLIGVRDTSEGKDPCFDHAREAGKREGMTEPARSSHPSRSQPAVDEPLVVSPVKAVRNNRGAAGVDRITLAAVEDCGVDRMLRELRRDLREGRYRPAPARRVDIPKPHGGTRPSGIPTVRDRVVQATAKIVLEPVFEADFLPSSYGFGPKWSATMAKERLPAGFTEGYQFVLEFDIANFFGEIEHERLLELGSRRVSDRRMLKLLRLWLQAGAMVEGVAERTVAGTPQGGVISPLLANIYPHVLDAELSRRNVGKLVRYADDGVVLCRTAAQAEHALAAIGEILASLGLGLHPEKTKVVDMWESLWVRSRHEGHLHGLLIKIWLRSPRRRSLEVIAAHLSCDAHRIRGATVLARRGRSVIACWSG